MKIFRYIAAISLLLSGITAFAQEPEKYDPYVKGKNDTLTVALTKVNDVMIPWLPLSDIDIRAKGRILTAEERAKYNRLRYNVLKVWPYAIFARNRYAQLQKDLALTGDRKAQKKLVKACEQQIKDMFNKEVKNMTITQGEILIKLIDRETGNSSYEMVRQLKGGITAFSYQVVARVFGHDLKEKYDPQEQRDIEAIIQSIEYRYN
ncbi:DUF4294 domain-containing protein [Hufsiella ginkgonis]|uniref:DUF4294 domain-containing protein n=1 Tax=Hufsiella ginkgonis TaxID=2695274 RepID=A0A7K1XXV4_9SPHI|nr:DUF4294 domain-containing protein [Hufsiella ginkgonis]MXV15831.1 DUF4294 domain-containing protein [Hufsiella ginkgonis]